MGQEEIHVMNSRADEMEVRMCLAKKKKKFRRFTKKNEKEANTFQKRSI